jgi:hypothetical protein
LGGIHVKLNWPEAWLFEGLDEELLPGQLLGYSGNGLHEMQYASAFHCLSGGGTRAVARFDVLATQPGAVMLDASAPQRIVNCDFEMRELADAGNGQVGANAGGRGEALSIVRLWELTSAAGVGFEVSCESPQLLVAQVYDVSGRMVRILESERMIVGSHVVRWSGHTDHGTPVPAGVYFVNFQFGSLRRVERALIVR